MRLAAISSLYNFVTTQYMIVLPNGFNVFPEDIERVLRSIGGVRDCAVIGRPREGKEEIHAVLVLDDPVSDAGASSTAASASSPRCRRATRKRPACARSKSVTTTCSAISSRSPPSTATS